MRINRRGFLIGGLALAGLGTAGAASHLSIDEKAALCPVQVPAFDLPKEFHDFRIGFISDIHFGFWIRNETVEALVNEINAAKPDIILLGGDHAWHHNPILEQIFPGHPNRLFDHLEYDQRPVQFLTVLADLLGALRARHGVYSVFGNHEHWLAPTECWKLLEARGIGCLLNRAVRVARGSSILEVYGMDDLWTGLPRAPFALSDAKARVYRILLTHNPDAFGKLLADGDGKRRFNLGLAGHTHGGQVKLPILGALHHNVVDRRFREGLFTLERLGLATFTTRGVGVVELPFRLNCPAEVNLIEFKPV